MTHKWPVVPEKERVIKWSCYFPCQKKRGSNPAFPVMQSESFHVGSDVSSHGITRATLFFSNGLIALHRPVPTKRKTLVRQKFDSVAFRSSWILIPPPLPLRQAPGNVGSLFCFVLHVDGKDMRGAESKETADSLVTLRRPVSWPLPTLFRFCVSSIEAPPPVKSIWILRPERPWRACLLRDRNETKHRGSAAKERKRNGKPHPPAAFHAYSRSLTHRLPWQLRGCPCDALSASFRRPASLAWHVPPTSPMTFSTTVHDDWLYGSTNFFFFHRLLHVRLREMPKMK